MDPGEQIGEARRLFESGLHEAAADLLREVLGTFPENIEALRELAQVRFAQGQRALGYSYLRRALLLEHELPEESPLEVAPPHEEDPDIAFAAEKAATWGPFNVSFSEWEHDSPEFGQEAGQRTNTPSVADRHPDASAAGEYQGFEEPAPRVSPSERKSESYFSAEGETAERELEPASSTSSSQCEEEKRAPGHSVSNQVEVGAPANGQWQPALPVAFSDTEETAEAQIPADDQSELLAGDPDEEAFADDEWDLPEELIESKTPSEPTVDIDWADFEVAFDDEEDDWAAVSAEVPEAPRTSSKVELWRRAEQLALELIRRQGRASVTAARSEVRLLAGMLLEGAAGVRRPDLSMAVRARHIGRIMDAGASLDDVTAAHACRHAWAENPEFHINLGSRHRGEAWTHRGDVAHLLPWSVALDIASFFHASEIEDFRRILFELYERWNSQRSLQRQFPMFRRYVHYRLLRTEDELDLLPSFVFDEPDFEDFVEQWEDDPTLSIVLRRELAEHGLIPQIKTEPWDYPFRAQVDHELTTKGKEIDDAG